ncbi:MAG: sulfite exporter TauE/SafE family protein, partial [Acidimicrobiales bacterium]
MARIDGTRLAWTLSAAATAIWFAAVALFDHWGRVLANWEAAATMLLGSFLAGSSPEGGGAVAFPIFTKGLHIPAPVARTFGLSIQAVGMTMAVVAIVLCGRSFARRPAIVASAAAITGLLFAVVAFGEPELAFWGSSIEADWTKATFSIVLAATSFLMVRHLRHGEGAHRTVEWNQRFDAALIVIAFAGGFLSALAGTGANILVFLFLVVIADIDPKTALPTALMVMCAVSLVGFVLFGLIDGQLSVELNGDRVVSVGGTATDLPASESDLFGLWLAAIPVVVWGAPLGSWAASKVKESHLVIFVACLAGL